MFQMTVSLKTEISCENIFKLLFCFALVLSEVRACFILKTDWILYVVPVSDFLSDLSCRMQIGKASIKDQARILRSAEPLLKCAPADQVGSRALSRIAAISSGWSASVRTWFRIAAISSVLATLSLTILKNVKYINYKSIINFKILLQISVNMSIYQFSKSAEMGCLLSSCNSSVSPGHLEPVLSRCMSSSQWCQGWDPAASAHGPGFCPDRAGLPQLGSTDSPAWTHRHIQIRTVNLLMENTLV